MKRKRVRVFYDQDPMDPRKEFDNLGTMACWHRRYVLGDEQPREDPAEYIKRIPKGSIILPLFLFDHSGITIRTSSDQFRAQDPVGWDWGRVGLIYVTPEKMRENFMVKRLSAKHRKTAEEVLEAEVKEYDQYLTNDVYGFVVEEAEAEEDQDDDELEWTQVDSCWGFFGSDPKENGMMEHVPKELHTQLKEAAQQPEYL